MPCGWLEPEVGGWAIDVVLAAIGEAIVANSEERER